MTTENPLPAPDWSLAQASSAIVLEAIRRDALVRLLIRKGIVSDDELAASVEETIRGHLTEVMGQFPTFEVNPE